MDAALTSMQLIWASFSFWTRTGIHYSHKQVGRSYTSYILRFISLAQTLILTCGNLELSKNDNTFVVGHLLEYLKDMIGFKKAGDLVEASSSILALITILVIYFLFLVIMIFLTLDLSCRGYYVTRSVKFVSRVTTLHAEVLFYPICLVLVNIIEMSFQNRPSIISKKICFPLLGTLFLINASVTFFKITICYSTVNFKNFISRKGSLHLLGGTILKLFLPILQLSSFKNNIGSKSLSEIASVTLSMVISFYVWRYSFVKLPEYDLKMMKGQIVFNSIITLVTLCQMTTLASGDRFIINLTFFVLPFWIKLNLILFEKILNKLLFHAKDIRNINYLVHLENVYENLGDGLVLNLTKKTFSKEALTRYGINSVQISNFFSSQDCFELIAKEKKFMATLLKMYYEQLQNRKLLNTLGSLSYANLIQKHFGMVPKAYTLCLHILNRKSSIPDKISSFHIIYKAQRIFQKEAIIQNQNTHSKLIWGSFLAEEAFNIFQASICKYIEATINYWEMFKAEKPDVSILIKQAKFLENQGLALETQWKNHESKFGENVPLAYLLHGSLQTQFLNRPWEGTDKIKKYNNITFHQNLAQERLSINPEDSAVVTISTEKKDMGNVLNVTEHFYKIFGIGKKSIIGQNINQIMPKFFAERHNQFLLDYFETGKNNLIGRETRQYAKDNNNNILPIYLSPILNMTQNQGVVVSALIRKVYDQKEFIILSEDGFIQEFSRKIGMLLNIEPYKKVHIQSVCPKYDLNNQDTYSTTFVGRTNSCEVSIKCKVKVESYNYGNSSLYVMILDLEEEITNSCLTLNIQKDIGKESLEIENCIKVENPDVSQNLPASRTLLEVKKATILVSTKFSYKEGSLALPQVSSDVLTLPRKLLSNNFSPVFPPEISSFSDKKESKNMSLEFETKAVDDIQDMYLKSYSKTSRLLFTGTFVLLLLLNFVMVSVQYFTSKASVTDIEFATEVVTASYSKLNALSWLYRYAIRYQAIVSKIATVTIAELDRYKITISSNRELVRAANNELLSSLVIGQEEGQRSFFRDNIEVDYNNGKGYLEERKTDSFQIISAFVEKLMTFDITPHSRLFQNGNPDLEFVRRNIPNSLLISSEGLIEITQRNLIDKIYAKNQLLVTIFSLSLMMTFLTISITIIISHEDLKNVRRLFQTLVAVNQKDVDVIISKLKFFNKVISYKESLIARDLYVLNVKQDTIDGKSGVYSLFSRKYNITGIISIKIKQCFFILILMIPFLVIMILEFDLTSNLLGELVITNNRYIVASKARYLINMASATVFDLIVFYNTTTLRHEPTAVQLSKNLDDIVSNEIIFKAFTDETGHFIDPSLETLFRGKPCALVVDYPGSNNPTNCPRATNYETFGIFGLNSQYYEEISAIGREMLDNLNLENARVMYPKMVNTLGHKTSTIVGAYIYVCDLMKKTFDKQVAGVFNDRPVRLAVELSFMIVIAIIVVWFLLKKILDDSHVRMVLQLVPYSMVLKNKFLKRFIKDLYRGKPELEYFEKQQNS